MVVAEHQEELVAAVVEYAKDFHAAVGDGHHVASPLGAWMLLALAGTAAKEEERSALAGVLRMDPAMAAWVTAQLFESDLGAIRSAAVAWFADSVTKHPPVTRWVRGLPLDVARGPIPSQEAADEWVREHSLGLIPRMPPVGGAALILASVLATKISWSRAFDLTEDASAARGGPWEGRLSRLLEAPGAHAVGIVDTVAAGRVGVHAAGSGEGLIVLSAIAGPPVPAADVVAAAHELAAGLSKRTRRDLVTGDWWGPLPNAIALHALPLGEGDAWAITKAEWEGAPREFTSAVLPCWSARSTHDLETHDRFGTEPAFNTLGRLLRDAGADGPASVTQTCTASYTREGFAAAALSGGALGGLPRQEEDPRVAEVRFTHPYAVVALVSMEGSRWDGVPVFSGWITEPDDPGLSPVDERDEQRMAMWRKYPWRRPTSPRSMGPLM